MAKKLPLNSISALPPELDFETRQQLEMLRAGSLRSSADGDGAAPWLIWADWLEERGVSYTDLIRRLASLETVKSRYNRHTEAFACLADLCRPVYSSWGWQCLAGADPFFKLKLRREVGGWSLEVETFSYEGSEVITYPLQHTELNILALACKFVETPSLDLLWPFAAPYEREEQLAQEVAEKAYRMLHDENSGLPPVHTNWRYWVDVSAHEAIERGALKEAIGDYPYFSSIDNFRECVSYYFLRLENSNNENS